MFHAHPGAVQDVTVGHNLNAALKPVNLILNSESLKSGKDFGLNIPVRAEAALAESVKACLAEA